MAKISYKITIEVKDVFLVRMVRAAFRKMLKSWAMRSDVRVGLKIEAIS